MIRRTTSASIEKFGSAQCVLTSVSEPRIGDMNEGEHWSIFEGIRFRKLSSPTKIVLGKNDLPGVRLSAAEYKCPDTLKFRRPEFFEVEERRRRYLAAVVTFDRLCGPVCGDQYSITFEKTADGWRATEAGITSTGVAF